MNTAHTITVDSAPVTPWRNGGGVTRELLAWPNPADWRLRISVADIAADGPFSAFPGVRRWFTLLSGEGVAQLADPLTVWLQQRPKFATGMGYVPPQ